MSAKKYITYLAVGILIAFAIGLLGRCSKPLPAEHSAYTENSDSVFTTIEKKTPDLDLEQIKKRGKLIALTSNSSTCYFVYRGQPMGYEYELLNRFASHLGVSLEIKVIDNVDKMFLILNQGEADIIANNLAVTKKRKDYASFSDPYNFTRQVLIQRLPDGYERMSNREINKRLLLEPLDLINKTIHVNRHSPFYMRLQNLSEEMGAEIDIAPVPGYIDTEKLIKKVAMGEIDYTVAEDNVGMINQTYYPNLDISLQLSFPQQVAWAVRKESPELLNAINAWFKQEQKTAHFAILFNKYFRSSKEQLARFNSSYSSIRGNSISEYDEIIKEYSQIIDWDWRLIAAQIYQESRFNKNARSWAGAFGLMQFMPATAAEFGIDTSSSEEEQIRAGILYLSWLDGFWKERIFDKEERIKYILASYNVGLGHVIDAMNMAVELDMDPLTWDGNVAECILLKAQQEYYTSSMVKHGYCRGEEPYNYVKTILAHYEHYKKVIS